MTITSNIPKNVLKQLLDIFPKRLSFAFAYGSGVFNQNIAKNEEKSKSNESKPMIDLILVVDDSQDFHKENLKKNRAHYSSLGYLGSKWLTTIQESFGAKVYFNTLIPIDNYLIKYGIINTKHLINDCIDWQTLYISGRLHKPVSILKDSNSSDLSNALKMNTENALHSALLLLSDTFTEEELYLKIAELSYLGDFRMTFGEDRNKVLKIVRPQIQNFRNIYQPLISSETLSKIVIWNPNSKVYSHDCSPKAHLYHLNLLPKTVEDLLAKEWNRSGEFTDMDDLLLSLAHSLECQTLVKNSIHNIVFKSSLSQSFKGLFSAGIVKTIHYSNRKIVKMVKSYK